MFLKLIIRSCYIAGEKGNRRWNDYNENTTYSLATNCYDHIQVLETIDPDFAINAFIIRPKDNYPRITPELYKTNTIDRYGDYYYECDKLIAEKLVKKIPSFLGQVIGDNSRDESKNPITTVLRKMEVKLRSELAKEQRLWAAIALTKHSLFNTNSLPKDMIKQILTYICNDERTNNQNNNENLTVINQKENQLLQTIENTIRNKM